jgi:tetratricopeptide (TPR) repeat protein
MPSAPGPPQKQRFALIEYDNIGRVLMILRRPEEALPVFQKAAGVAEKLANSDPENADAQVNLGRALFRLAAAGVDPLTNYTRAADILMRLDESGRLDASWRPLMAEAIKRRDALTASAQQK